MTEYNYVMPDILGMIADPTTSEDEIARALWKSWGYMLPGEADEETVKTWNDEVRKARLAYERKVLGLAEGDQL